MLDYDDLIALTDLNHLPPQEALDHLGTLIDLAHELGKAEGTLLALQWCETLDGRELSASECAELDYFWANAWGDLQSARHADPAVAWAWEQPEQRKQIFHLRRALTNNAFEDLAHQARHDLVAITDKIERDLPDLVFGRRRRVERRQAGLGDPLGQLARQMV